MFQVYSTMIQFYIYIYILFQILFHYKLLQEIEYSSLCYTVCGCVWHSCSIMSDLCDPWIVAHQTPLSIEFSRQEYWSGLPLLSPQDLPGPRIKPVSPALRADSLPAEPQGNPLRTFLGLDGKASVYNEGDLSSIPGSGRGRVRSPWEGNGNPIQYSCLENSMDREAW